MWNKWKLIFAGLAISTSAFAVEQPPVDRDAFEKQYMECIMNNFNNECIAPLSRFIWGNKDAESFFKIFNTTVESFVEETSVYKIHPVYKKISAEIFDERLYLIETRDEEIFCTRIIFTMREDKWYVSNILVTGKKADVEKLLDISL